MFRTGNVTVALTARPMSFLDPEYYRALGICPEELAVAVTRSGYHFTLNFAGTGECITVDTPGLFNAAGSADWKGVPEPVDV